jgi:hypothetical protein
LNKPGVGFWRKGFRAGGGIDLRTRPEIWGNGPTQRVADHLAAVVKCPGDEVEELMLVEPRKR